MEQNKKQLKKLQRKMLIAEIRKEEIEQIFNDVYDEVLNESIYINPQSRERITTESDSYFLEDNELERFSKEALNKFIERGMTECDGTYKPTYDGVRIQKEAEDFLIDFMLPILPKSLSDRYKNLLSNYILRKKFINVIMSRK
jgi:site-specific DNA-cytosine methylase